MMQDSNILFEEKKAINEYIAWDSVKTMQF